MGKRLLALTYFHIQFPVTFNILMQYLNAEKINFLSNVSPMSALNQGFGVETDAEAQSGQGRTLSS